MANLRDLTFGYGEGAAMTPGEFTVYNTSTTSAANGGFCCLWTVPNGVSYAVFEMWSGGGSGDGGCCCMQGGGAGAGGYAIKARTVTPGEGIRVCAAASNCCRPSQGNYCGCCTFVCSESGGVSGRWESKVCGGRGTIQPNVCRGFISCYSCCSMCYCCGGRAEDVDLSFPGITGTAHRTQHCFDDGYQVAANAPMTGGGIRMGFNGCCARGGGTSEMGLFPGGGGFSGQAFGGGCCCSSAGAGGMVYVVYY